MCSFVLFPEEREHQKKIFSRNFAFIMIAHNLHHILYIYKARGIMKYLNTFVGDQIQDMSVALMSIILSIITQVYVYTIKCVFAGGYRERGEEG